MSAFEESIIQRIKRLEREIERLQRWERPTDGSGVTDHGDLTGLLDDDHTQYTKHPASSTDNAVVRWNGTDGRTIQNSGVTIDDSNNIKVGTAPVPTSVTSSTDNAVVRFDSTGGNKIQNSGVIINDSGQISGNGLDGWIYDTDTWTYVSATSFKIAGKNVAYRFPKGTKIKLVQSGSTKYFYVTAATFSTDTTVTVTGGSDYSLANAAISGQAYSYAAAPQNFPQWFNWEPIFTGFSTQPTGTHIFNITGNTCHLFIKEDTGTSNSTSFSLTIPVSSAYVQYYAARICNNGTIPTTPGLAEIAGGGMNIYKTFEGWGFETSGTKYTQLIASYPF